MHSHVAEIMIETWFQESPCSGVKSLTRRAQCVMHDRGDVRRACGACLSMQDLVFLAALPTLRSVGVLAAGTFAAQNSALARRRKLWLGLCPILPIHFPIPHTPTPRSAARAGSDSHHRSFETHPPAQPAPLRPPPEPPPRPPRSSRSAPHRRPPAAHRPAHPAPLRPPPAPPPRPPR